MDLHFLQQKRKMLANSEEPKRNEKIRKVDADIARAKLDLMFSAEIPDNTLLHCRKCQHRWITRARFKRDGSQNKTMPDRCRNCRGFRTVMIVPWSVVDQYIASHV